MQLYEMVYGTFFEPGETFRYISQKKPLFYGLAVVSVVYLFGFLVDMGSLQSSLPEIKRMTSLSPMDPKIYWMYSIIGLPAAIFMWFIMSAVYSMMGKLICGKDNPEGIMSNLAFAMLPGILAAPFQVIGSTLGWNAISLISGVSFMIWIAALQIIGLREALDVEIGQAMAVWFVPLAAIILFVIFIAIFLVGVISQLS